MKLIIDIPEYEYMEIKRYYDNLPMYSTVEAELYYIAHGTPLPKEHGRLIDADRLRSMYSINRANFNTVVGIQKWIDNAPTIIEAESEGV